MFSKKIIDSDQFLGMSLSTQALYFHLSMRADDDGFVNNPKTIQKMIGASDDEMKMLIAKQYLIPFESGLVVIKHWKIHNYIQKDRYKPSNFPEKEMLELNKASEYQLSEDLYTNCIQNVYIGKDRLGKDRLGKDRLDILSGKPDQLSTEIKAIVNYLNEVSGKNFRFGTPKTKALIKARLNEGFSVDDFKAVIDKKYKQWRGGDMEKYIRPETLFGTKFEGYLNESDVVEMAHKKQEETPTDRVNRMLANIMNEVNE